MVLWDQKRTRRPSGEESTSVVELTPYIFNRSAYPYIREPMTQESIQQPMTQENRRAPRQQLIASAELIDVRSDARMKARTSDMSVFGCYLDTMSTLPPGTDVKLKITHNGATVTVVGMIANSQPHMGMGIRFTEVSVDDLKLLRTWLRATWS